MGLSDWGDVIAKWLSVPFGIACVVVAGSAFNLEKHMT